MEARKPPKGPASHRFLVMMLNVFLAILFYWLLGFILHDVSNHQAPSWTDIQKQYQDSALVTQRNQLSEQDKTLRQKISNLREQQTLVQTSTNSYRDTMNQLLDVQKANEKKNVSLTSQEQQNLANATKLYLDNQQKFQNINDTITQAKISQQEVANQLIKINTDLDKQQQLGDDFYNKELLKYNLKSAVFKLIILIPLLLITAYFFRQYRESIYRPMIMAVGIAIIARIVLVMHEHFPSRAFKYLLIVVLLILVARALIYLLRMMITPKSNWLLKQYREAYKKLLCPSCDYPIRPGVLKYSTLTQDHLKNITLTDSLKPVEKYSCPGCGIKLFEPCSNCKATRHTLLEFCESCGVKN